MKEKILKNKGYSLIETIIYSAMLVVLIASIVYATTLLFGSYKKTKATRQIEVSAIDAMDRIIRDVRDADSVDVSNSSFNTASGVLSLISGATTTKFYLSGQRIYINENAVSQGALTQSAVNVTSLIFRYIQATSSVAVKVEMTMTSSSSPSFTKNFYDSAVLRGSY